jgi:hypothetical protein
VSSHGRTWEDLRREIYVLMNRYAQTWTRRDKMKMDALKALLHSTGSEDELYNLLMSTEGIGQFGNQYPMTADNWDAFKKLSTLMALIRLRNHDTKDTTRLQVFEEMFKRVQMDVAARSFHRQSVVPIIPGQYDEDEQVMRRRGPLQIAGEESDQGEPGEG